ncbi:MAG: efflux RND transporter periplasmic adaptor subunit [Pirellulales bacterium]
MVEQAMKMGIMKPGILKSRHLRAVSLVAAAAVVVIAIGFARGWFSPTDSSVAVRSQTTAEQHDDHGHDHAHPGHQEANSLELSEQARKNIGLQLATIELQPFEKTITVPGIVVERPGRTTIEVTAPMTGVITRIAAVQGEAVKSGQLLFEMRLTHEELVQAQGDLLRTAEGLEVTQREIDRIEDLVKTGALAGKALIDLNYEKQKAEALLRAQSQTLVLHGLSQDQVDEILKSRKLLQKLSVFAPDDAHTKSESAPRLLQVQELKVDQGQHVTAGDTLCVLADHSELFIEGKAFEQDVEAVSAAASKGWPVSAVVESKASRPQIIPDLKLLYLANKVDPDTRAFHFYVTLPNRVLQDNQSTDGRRFLTWEFKPGQRMQVRVPVERWTDRIVLPIEAVATEGGESYVFQANGDHFDRRPVHVEYRDQFWAVIANDSSLYPGDVVAKTGAFQLQTALKNKAGGAIDPHAGHNH